MTFSSLVLLMLFTISCFEAKKTAEKNSIVVETETVQKIDSINKKEYNELLEDSTSIHSLWEKLLIKYVSEHGEVNYKGFKNDWHILKTYIHELEANIPVSDSPKEEKLAYWINAYNAFTIDLILRNYPLKSIKDIKDPWNQKLWKLGNMWYNLDDIEHQILRKMGEPRIHFAIVCASYSCPKLSNKAFEAETLENQLTNATHEFLSDPKHNTISKTKLELSKIFQWFSKDFKQNGGLIEFLNQYSDIGISDDAKISYKKYNWDLNE